MRFEPLVHALLVHPHQKPAARHIGGQGGGQQALLPRSVQFSHEFILKFSKSSPLRRKIEPTA